LLADRVAGIVTQERAAERGLVRDTADGDLALERGTGGRRLRNRLLRLLLTNRRLGRFNGSDRWSLCGAAGQEDYCG